MFVLHDLSSVRDFVIRLAKAVGHELIISGHRKEIVIHHGYPKDIDSDFEAIYRLCQPYTMTSLERMYALYQATKYIVNQRLPGSFVFCGVWRGGSAMVSALTLRKIGDTSQMLYLYDTYAGMTRPTADDRRLSDNKLVEPIWCRQQRDDHNEYAYAPLDEVKKNMNRTGYPDDKIKYIKGRVEETIPAILPETIALLRLDTDWYQSTYHELKHLYPLLVRHGVLFIDDYGHFTGARKAVDQYLHEEAETVLLNRIDHTGRMGIKVVN